MLDKKAFLLFFVVFWFFFVSEIHYKRNRSQQVLGMVVNLPVVLISRVNRLTPHKTMCRFQFQAAIRKELNEYKSNEMEVHASSKHLTRSDFYLCEFWDTHSVVFIKEKCMEEARIQVNKCSISVGNRVARIMLLD